VKRRNGEKARNGGEAVMHRFFASEVARKTSCNICALRNGKISVGKISKRTLGFKRAFSEKRSVTFL